MIEIEKKINEKKIKKINKIEINDKKKKKKKRNLKILYVNPGRIEAGLDAVIKGPPLALITIAAMVPEHEAELFDFKVDKYDEQKFRRKLREADVVAISSMTPQIEHALTIAQMAKEENTITIIGGYHPTLVPNEVAAHPAIDYCVRGEGEHTFRELINYIANSQEALPLEKINGISYKINGKIIHNKERLLEKDLDNFPIPKYELLKGKPYMYMGTKVLLMETSRGCPHNCKFCSIIKMWRDSVQHLVYRKKSVKRVMQEIYKIYNLKGQNWDFIFFNDDNFTINVKHTEKILKAIKKSNMNHHFHFSCQSRVDTLSRNPWLVKEMYEAGFKQIFLGIESVHQSTLDNMNKHTNTTMVKKAVNLCHKYGITIFAGVILGFPGETAEMVRQTIDFALELDVDFAQFTPITAFPGTPFYQELKEKGQIKSDNWKFYNLFTPMMGTEEISRKELFDLVAEAYAKFYMNAAYIRKMGRRLILQKEFRWYWEMWAPWLKQFAGGGLTMLHSQGITGDIIKKDPKLNKRIGRNTMRQLRKLYWNAINKGDIIRAKMIKQIVEWKYFGLINNKINSKKNKRLIIRTNS